MAAEPFSSRRLPRGRHARFAAGFTLTELLTVVGLVALIAALMLPVIGRVRTAAAAAACLAHLRQAGTAWTMYVMENRGRLPQHTGYHEADLAWKESWPGILERQKVNVSTLRCPAADDPRPAPDHGPYGSTTCAWTGKYAKVGPIRFNLETYRESSYGYNGYLAAGAGTGSAGDKNYLSAVNSPSTVPVLFDSAYAEVIVENGKPESPVRPPPDLSGNGIQAGDPDHWNVVLARHGRGINLYMADGSAAWVRLDDLYTLTWKDGWLRYRLPLPAR